MDIRPGDLQKLESWAGAPVASGRSKPGSRLSLVSHWLLVLAAVSACLTPSLPPGIPPETTCTRLILPCLSIPVHPLSFSQPARPDADASTMGVTEACRYPFPDKSPHGLSSSPASSLHPPCLCMCPCAPTRASRPSLCPCFSAKHTLESQQPARLTLSQVDCALRKPVSQSDTLHWTTSALPSTNSTIGHFGLVT